MKTLFKKVFVASTLAAVAVCGAQAQSFPMTTPMPNFPQVACMTPNGVFPMSSGNPGWTCGNGFDHGVTILLSQTPQVGISSGPGFPGSQGSAPSLGERGQVAGLLGANREMQLAAECTSAGHPKAVASCIAVRLTAAEMDKCKNGIGSANGCFGPNNTLRLHLEGAIAAAQRESGVVDQAIRVGTGISPKDIRENDWRGGPNSFFNCPFGGC